MRTSRTRWAPLTPPRAALTTVTAAMAALLLVACGSAEDDTLPGIDPVEDGDTADPQDGPDSRDDDAGDRGRADGPEGTDVDETDGGAPSSERPEVASAISDAAERTGTDPDDIEVVRFEEVTWSDGSMGCPEPEQMYTQALVEGYRLVLDVDGAELTYHGAEDGEPFLCDDPQDPLEVTG